MKRATKQMVVIAQHILNKHYATTLTTDGVAGKNTMNAIWRVTAVPTEWNENRQIIGVVQHGCQLNALDAGPIDGYWGPQTSHAFDEIKEIFNSGKPPVPWRDDEGIGGDEVDPNNDWPLQTQNSLVKYYGKVGTNQTKITVPYPLRIAWNVTQRVTKVTCHEKVADSVVRILTRTKDHYDNQIAALGLDLFGGCLNVRKMRGGSKWSTHSWGIAFDWDPTKNQLRWKRNKANFAKPVYDVWWSLWEDEGWVSLGRTRNYDYMHVQACRVR